MTYRHHSTLPTELLESIAEQGLDAIPEMIRTLLNQAMLMERQKYLHAAPYERTAERQGYANGFKPKTVATRMGKITFDMPQVREGEFYPSTLEKGLRSERALKLALAEMYIQGVSTRKVAAITQELCGFEVSSTQVSQATALLDDPLEAWRTRPLGCYPYVYLDARYEKVRRDGLGWDDGRWQAEWAAYVARWRTYYSLPPHEAIPNWRVWLAEKAAPANVPEMEVGAGVDRTRVVAGVLLGTAVLSLASYWLLRRK